jgi:transposase InsO family protein
VRSTVGLLQFIRQDDRARRQFHRPLVGTSYERTSWDPKSDPTKGTWADFLKSRAKVLWQCDFFAKHIVMAAGIRQCFVLAFIHVQTRGVLLSPSTFKPDAAWMTSQAERFLAHAKAQHLAAGIVLRDHDCKYTAAAFDRILEAGAATVKVVGYRPPNQNAYVERFGEAIERKCLDKFIVFWR